jgi:hypothetical protein
MLVNYAALSASSERPKFKIAQRMIDQYAVFDELTPDQVRRVRAALEDSFWRGCCFTAEYLEKINANNANNAN